MLQKTFIISFNLLSSQENSQVCLASLRDGEDVHAFNLRPIKRQDRGLSTFYSASPLARVQTCSERNNNKRKMCFPKINQHTLESNSTS